MRSGFLGLLLVLAAPTAQEARLPALIDEEVRKISGFGRPPATTRCDDGEFLRRAMLDLVGYPPTADQVRRFVADPDPDKRGALVDRLLESDRYADFWARRWMSVFFGNYHVFRLEPLKSLDPDDAARIMESFRRWLQERLKKDVAWVDIVRDLLEAEGPSSMTPALAYKLGTMGWPRHPFYENRAVQQFMGIDISCTGCHDHPFDKWRVEDCYSLMAFSTGRTLVKGPKGLEIQEEPESHLKVVRMPTIRFEKEGPIAKPLFIGNGGAPAPGEVLAKAFARMMTAPDNLQFRKAVVNRIWFWLLGRGLVHPVDDFNMKNKPLSPGLLRTLATEFQKSGHSIKSLVRAICRSEAYQRKADGPGDYTSISFSRCQIRPLSAEQILNSLETATRGGPTFDVVQAQSLAELMIRGDRPVSEVEPVPMDARSLLWLSNGDRVRALIKDGAVIARIRALQQDQVKELFLALLSREPAAEETRRFETFIRDRGVDEAAWVLLNSAEFLTRH